jgi:hypothetical protein
MCESVVYIFLIVYKSLSLASEFIRVLEAGLRDPIEHFRLRLLRTLIDLLEARPLHEQSMLLSVLANKVIVHSFYSAHLTPCIFF